MMCGAWRLAIWVIELKWILDLLLQHLMRDEFILGYTEKNSFPEA